MTRLPIGIGVALFMFGFAATVAIALRHFLTLDPSAVPAVTLTSEPLKRETIPDRTVYPVSLCDLVNGKDRYDSKFVSMEVVYEQGVDTAALTDPRCQDSWLRPACFTRDETCEAIWKPLTDELFRGHSLRFRIDVIGRYVADIEDPNPLQRGSHVRMLELIALTNPKPEKRRE